MVELMELRHGTELLKRGFAKMQKGGVIMDVTNAEQAAIAEDAGAVAVMALKAVPADIRKEGGVARMADPLTRVEIKGVQSLGMIEKVIEGEVIRQLNMMRVIEELRRRRAYPERSVDVSNMLSSVKNAHAFCLRNFDDLLKREIQAGRCLASEFRDRAEKYGVVMIVIPEEADRYGIKREEIELLRGEFAPDEDDRIVLVVGRRAREAAEAMVKFADTIRERIPEETRRAMSNGSTAYLRPLPGVARMYPETDIPPIEIDESRYQRIEIPELLEDRKRRYIREYGLSEELADKISKSSYFELFERVIRQMGVVASVVARTLTDTLSELRREGVAVERIDERHLMEIFRNLSEGRFAKEGVVEILRYLADSPEEKVEDVIRKLGLGSMGAEDVEKIVEGIVERKRDLIKERGLNATGPLMGLIMKELRGKADGKLVNRILRDKISRLI